MAYVTGKISIAKQIRLVIELRWRILRNNLRRKNNRLDLIGLIWAAVFFSLVITSLALAFCWGAYFSVSTDHVGWLLLIFWSIFLFWQAFPIFVAGFGATFEFRTLLRFPLSLTAFYLLALAYGLADFAAIASICWLLAVTVGAAIASPGLLPSLFMVVVLFALMNTTLERLLGSWLERLLSRRRTREVVFGLFILLSISLQFIRPLISTYATGIRSPSTMARVFPYLSLLPPSLAGRALAGAAAGEKFFFVENTLGLIAYIGVFSVLLWFRFAAQYRGEELSEAASPARPVVRPVAKLSSVPDFLSLLSPAVEAVVRKEFRYLSRNGFVLISLLLPPILVLLFSSQFGGRHPTVTHRAVSPDLFFPGMMGYLILMLMTPAYNCFAYEGCGVHTYFTAPLQFRDVLLGKNFVHSSIMALEVILSIAVLGWRIGFPSASILVATLAAIVFAVVSQFAIANWVSLSFPRKLEFGSMRGQRSSGVSIWVAFGVQLLLGGICSLILLVGHWTHHPWLPAEAFAGLAAASIAGYFAALDVLSGVAEKKKAILMETLCR